MKQTFNDYRRWKKAAEQRGLIVEVDAPSHEGMHEDDLYATVWAYQKDPDAVKDGFVAHPCDHFMFGWFAQDPETRGEGYLFDTVDEAYQAMNEGQDVCPAGSPAGLSASDAQVDQQRSASGIDDGPQFQGTEAGSDALRRMTSGKPRERS